MFGLRNERQKRDEIADILVNRLKYLYYSAAESRILYNIHDLVDAGAIDDALEQCKAMDRHMLKGEQLPAVRHVPPRRRTTVESDDCWAAFYLIGRLLK